MRIFVAMSTQGPEEGSGQTRAGVWLRLVSVLTWVLGSLWPHRADWCPLEKTLLAMLASLSALEALTLKTCSHQMFMCRKYWSEHEQNTNILLPSVSNVLCQWFINRSQHWLILKCTNKMFYVFFLSMFTSITFNQHSVQHLSEFTMIISIFIQT